MGGKKKKGGKGKQPDEPAKLIENCVIFVGTEFPEYQKKVLDILNTLNFVDGEVDFVKPIKESIPDKKQQGLAMKVAAFKVAEVKETSKEEALRL